MTATLDPNNRRKNQTDKGLRDVSYDYDYPRGLDLKPGSDLHDKLRDEVLDRAQESFRIMQRRHEEWRSIDRVMRAYVPADAEDDEDAYPQIIMPQSYATKETLLTYMSAAFLQNPIFKYSGTGPEDVYGAELMTKIIQKHNRKFGNGLALHTMWEDGFKYGVGAVSPTWERKMGHKTIKQEQGYMSWVRKMFIKTGEERTQSEYGVLFEGNKLENIDPYKMLPDPNTSAHEVQEGEFFGWIDRSNYMKLLRRERDESDFIFNAKYVDHLNDAFSDVVTSGQGREKGKQKRGDSYIANNPTDIIWMYVDIIPSEWDLGKSQYPEKWLFGLAGDQVIIACMPLGLDHGMIPAAICAPDYDGYSTDPASRLGIVHDLQGLMDFLYSSHVQNVKKIINDMLVVDPSLVNIHDVNDPKAGKIIRMRRRAWGQGGIDEAIQQLNVQDVTQNHVADTQYLGNIMQSVSGAQDNLKGQLQERTTRISASEFQGIRSSSLSRLEKDARIISMQAMMPIARMMASHTQQLMEEETYAKVTGEWKKRLKDNFGIDAPVENNRVPIRPLDLVVDYDLDAHDGTIPGSGDQQTWLEIFQTVAQQPLLQKQFDITRIFEYLAEQAGAKNIEDFKRKVDNQPSPQVVSDEEAQEEMRKGNIRPAQSENGQRPRG